MVADLGRVWAQARAVRIEDAVGPDAPRWLLHARFADASALEASSHYGSEVGGLLLSAPGPVLGDVVELVVAIESGPVRMWCARGRVAGRRVRRGRAGDDLDVVLLADEQVAWERLEAITLGVAPERLDRTEERLSVKLKAQIRLFGEETRRVTAVDLSRGGAGFADRAEPPEIGTPVDVEVKQGLFGKPLTVRGLVCWAAAGKGFGVRFLYDSARQREEVAALLAKAA